MIQILTYSGKESSLKGNDVVLNKLHDAQSLDEFDINIINLKDENIWRNTGSGVQTINCIEDFRSISIMVNESKKTTVLFVLPMNVRFLFNSYYEGGVNKYHKSCELKNMLESFMNSIMNYIYDGFLDIKLVYENTTTTIDEKDVSASFYFYTNENVLLSSNKSNKTVAIRQGKTIITTLDLKEYDETIGFLKKIGLIMDKQDAPIWMEDVHMFDDDKQLGIIEENNQIIRKANEAIAGAIAYLDKNKRYKSILYTNGNELVEVVFEILTEMLGCDLSEFEDKKKEDFLFNVDGHTFIGEIKGVNHNVKSENVSQLDVHYQSYKDDHPDVDEKDLSALLIMDHQKNKPVAVREPVHENQIGLAERNGSLIIDTMTLLKMFEKYLGGDLTREQCIELLSNNTGILQLT